MLVRLPIGTSGIPLGEIVLIFVLLTIHYPSTLPHLSLVFPVLLLFFWWSYIAMRVLSGISTYGLWALRDASNVMESLFILAGFTFAQRPESLIKFYNWLPKFLIIGVIYGMTYPFADSLQSLSPNILSGAGKSIPIFFTYTNSSVILLLSACYLFIFKQEIKIYFIFPLAVFLIAFTILLFQARTVYLQILALFIFFFIYRRNIIGKSFLTIIFCIGFVALMPILDISIYGRLDQAITIKFLFNHFLAIGGIENEGVVGAAKGVGLRLEWWLSLYYRLTANFRTFLEGIGYGFPLIDFKITGGIPIREPHNSYISIVSRSGIIGLLFFSYIHFLLIKTWLKSYKICKNINWTSGENQLLILMAYFVLIWVFAIGEDAFEKPYNTIPYYFFWGIVLRFYYHLKQKKIGPDSTHHENSLSS